MSGAVSPGFVWSCCGYRFFDPREEMLTTVSKNSWLHRDCVVPAVQLGLKILKAGSMTELLLQLSILSQWEYVAF